MIPNVHCTSSVGHRSMNRCKCSLAVAYAFCMTEGTVIGTVGIFSYSSLKVLIIS